MDINVTEIIILFFKKAHFTNYLFGLTKYIPFVFISLIPAIVSIYQAHNTKNNNAKILEQQQTALDADVISKSRIDWIQSVRGYLCDFLTLSVNMKHYYSIYKVSKGSEFDTQEFKYYNDKAVQYQSLKQMLILNLGPEKKPSFYPNKEFIIMINEVYDQCFENLDNDVLLESDENMFNKSINELVEFGRNYFKQEWDKAKNFE